MNKIKQVKKSLKVHSTPLISGSVRWWPRVVVNKRWYQIGVYTSPRGMCSIKYEVNHVNIHTVVDGVEHVAVIDGVITPTGVAKHCGNLLKKLNQIQNG